MNLSSFLLEQKEQVELALKDYMSQVDAPETLVQAMDYSLMAGGKRIRPAFLMATIDALGGDWKQGLFAASAVEMIHTYSLIHDDLPAMDDDDYRRGKLTNHKVFGEGMAILAGDALLTHAFYLMTRNESTGLSADVLLKMVQELALYAGAQGMVGGQVADILGEQRKLTLDELYYIHQHKTADLLTCSVRLGAYIGQASMERLEHLTDYALHIGLAFQIQDDILDEIGDEHKLGKKVGSDREKAKNTFVSLLGLEGAKEKLQEHISKAKEALYKTELPLDLLMPLTDYMVDRDR